MGRADDAHVDRNLLAPADALDHALLQEAQQLRLQRHRQVADLVQEQRAAVRGLDLAERLLGRAGERALLVAEQLALEQRFRDRGAIDGDESRGHVAARVACSARASSSLPVPDSPSSSTVADVGATFSIVRQIRCISGSRVMMPDMAGACCCACRRRFSSCRSWTRNARSIVQDRMLGLERLGAEVVGAERDRPQRVRAIVLAGQDDHLGVRRERVDLLEQLTTLASDHPDWAASPRSIVTTAGS